MEQQSTFQWSIFTRNREQQYVVRSDDYEQFFAAIQQVLQLLPELKQQVTAERHNATEQAAPLAQPAAPPAGATPYCPLHPDKRLRFRTGKDGQTSWYDHRWTDELGKWHACNGKSERVDGGTWHAVGEPIAAGAVSSNPEG